MPLARGPADLHLIYTSLRECRWVGDAVVQSLAEAVGPAGRLEELDLSWTAVTDQVDLHLICT